MKRKIMEQQKDYFGVTTKRIALIVLVAFAIGFIVGMAVQSKYRPCVELPVVDIKRDTVTVRDTVAGKILPPKKQIIIRVDTVRLQINPQGDGKYEKDTTTRKSTPDTLTSPRLGQNGEVLIPITRKEYQTDQYRAVVSGWRPSLDTIELYRDTRTITETVTKVLPPKRKYWALTVGPGVGYAPDKTFRPYIGAALGFVVWSK